MELSSFVANLPGFHERPSVFKLEAFSWYLHQVCNRDRVQAVDLLPCFDAVHCARPANIYHQLNALCLKKPARMLKDAKGYRLSAAARDEMQNFIPVRGSIGQTTALLAGLLPKVTQPSEHAFLTETITCYGHGAYRAAIVMMWNLAYSHLCDLIYARELSVFNAQLAKMLPKADEVVKRSDFEDLKESKVIEVARGAGIISATTAKILREKLSKRNIAAHPSPVKVTAVTAEEVIHDLVENVLLADPL